MGIGRAISEKLLQNGAKVALLDINETAGKSLIEALQKTYGGEKTLFISCDVTSEEQVKAAFQKAIQTFGGIDILFNNAGMVDESLWEKTVTTNFVSVIRGTYLAMDHMNKLNGGRGGVIIITSSLAGVIAIPSCPVYTATKHGLIGFTRSIAAASQASGYGIRFNALCPGAVQTQMFTEAPSRLGRYSHLQKEIDQLTEQLGVINPSEVAEAVLEMVTDETKNGEAMCVDKKGKRYLTFPSFT